MQDLGYTAYYHLATKTCLAVLLSLMARILCIDYGLKRCGIAATDSLQIAVHPVGYVATTDVLDYITDYLSQEHVELLVMGDGRHHDGNASDVTLAVGAFTQKLHKRYPNLKVELTDESYTSAEAKDLLLQMGTPKMKRREKGLVDQLSAVLILQRYLGHI